MCVLRTGNLRRSLCRGAWAWCLALFLVAAFAQPVGAEERARKIEAAFLYNFFNYITWPDYQSPEQMRQAAICVPADDPILPFLEYIRSRREGERELAIREIDNKMEMDGCQLLFVRNPGPGESARLRSMAEEKKVLFVSAQSDASESGGLIGITSQGEHLAMDIDNTRLKEAGFQVSSRLLDLARRVR